VQVVNILTRVRGRRAAHRAERPSRKSSILSALAIVSVAGFVAVPLAGPSSVTASAAWSQPGEIETVNLLVTGDAGTLVREDFSVAGGWRTAPAAGRPDPGSAQAIALDQVLSRGWDTEQYGCLYALWAKESGWNHFAMNKSSGAYGIPQSLPGEKMASAGADWATNPATQIRWGLGYIEARYGTPCSAWGHSQQKNWY
jgi:hypothetical protein